ncbi:MAG: hypothetical protein V1902_03860 [Candidatus Falkowbacteria bacterium]
MKKTIVLLVSMMVVMALAVFGCEREVSVFDDREPTVVNVEGDDAPAYVGMVSKTECGVVTDDADETDMNMDCASLGMGWYCASNKQASDDLGSPTNLCVPGCYVVFEFDPYTGEQAKSYDSCTIIDESYACSAPQFDGDGQCHKVTPGTTPTGTGTTPTPAAMTTGKLVKTCYALTAAEISADFGQMSWSEATSSDPSKWGSAQDLVIGSDGCFSGYLSTYAIGCEVVVDLTVGKHAGKTAGQVTWIGAAKTPASVMVSGKAASYVKFDPYRGHVYNYCL